MNTSSLLQTIGNVCVAVAAFVFLVPLQRLLGEYAGKYPNDDRWATPALLVLTPLWLSLLGGLLCMTATGGFDWLRLGRPVLYPLAVGASIALGALSFVFIALYIRPGFTPRFLYVPVIYLVPFTTALLVVLSLNARFLPGFPLAWLRLPWTGLAGLSLGVGLAFVGHRLLNSGLGNLGDFAGRVLRAHDATPEKLAKIATLDPESEDGFAALLGLARGYQDRRVRESATARLRSARDFADRLAEVLERSRGDTDALEFVSTATLSKEERQHLARPALIGLRGFINDIPAPNYITRQRQKQFLKWGRQLIPAVIAQFSGTDVDFSPVMPAFEHALRPDDSRR